MDIKNLQEFRTGLRALEREIGKQLKDDTSCCGIRVDECHAMMELDECREIAFKDLAEKLNADKGNLSRTIESLVKRGFVKRTGSGRDRRAVIVSLTEQGKLKAGSINETCNPVYDRLFEFIPGNKHNTVIEGIKLLAAGFRDCHKAGGLSDCCNNPEKNNKRFI